MSLPIIKLKHYHAMGFDEDEFVLASVAKEKIVKLNKRIQDLEKIAEAASWLVIKIEDGVNVGRYRHCGNGSTYIPFDRWEALNNAFEECPPLQRVEASE